MGAVEPARGEEIQVALVFGSQGRRRSGVFLEPLLSFLSAWISSRPMPFRLCSGMDGNSDDSYAGRQAVAG